MTNASEEGPEQVNPTTVPKTNSAAEMSSGANPVPSKIDELTVEQLENISGGVGDPANTGNAGMGVAG